MPIITMVIFLGLVSYIIFLKKEVKNFKSAFEYKREESDRVYSELKETREELSKERKALYLMEKKHKEEIISIKDMAEMPKLRKELETLKYQSNQWLKENIDNLLSTLDVNVTLYRGDKKDAVENGPGRWWSTNIEDAKMYANKYKESVIFEATFELKAKDYQGFLFIYDNGHETHTGWGTIPKYLTGSGEGNWFYLAPNMSPLSVKIMEKELV